VLTDPKLRSQVDQLWDRLWTGGLSNPLDAIEQFSYLLYLKRLDGIENRNEQQARRRGQPYTSRVPNELRWGYWTNFKAENALENLALCKTMNYTLSRVSYITSSMPRQSQHHLVHSPLPRICFDARSSIRYNASTA
jgi:hypothetical protein